MKTSITPEPAKTIMPPTERMACQIPASYAGMRLDQALADLLPAYSRNRLQQWLKAGQLRVDGQVRRPRTPVAGGETVSGEWTLEDGNSPPWPRTFRWISATKMPICW